MFLWARSLSRINPLSRAWITSNVPMVSPCMTRHISMSMIRFQEEQSDTTAENAESKGEVQDMEDSEDQGSTRIRSYPAEERDPKDRTRDIPVELSIKYMESDAYQQTYGQSKIWELYRRNFSKNRTYKPTRKTCIRHGMITTGNPCPICRDEYLVVDYRNLKLLNQFVADYNGQLLTSKKTGVCQKQWMKIRIELTKARDHGYLNVDPPFVEYDYDKYRPKEIC